MTLLVSCASYILASLHSHTSHIFTITTLSHSTSPLEIQETIYMYYIISFTALRFIIKPQINELVI